jgi:hypothetical protein
VAPVLAGSVEAGPGDSTALATGGSVTLGALFAVAGSAAGDSAGNTTPTGSLELSLGDCGVASREKDAQPASNADAAAIAA